MRSDLDFESLVLEHHAALYRFALSMCRREPDAADLVQDTFVRWAERGHQLEDPTRVRSWLFTTLFREANARRRRLARFPESPLEEVAADLPDIPPDGPQVADGRAVLDALSRVDDHFRAAVSLFYLEDYSYPEIAAILEIPVGTVKSRIARGMAQLQRLLQPDLNPNPRTSPASA